MTTQADFAVMLEKSEELNLSYKTKIIELENELNHERIRAREYQSKFKDAILQSQFEEGQDLLEKLNNKEKQLMDSRKQVLELNRRLANTSHAPTQTDLIALARENEELMENIEQIKSAAISAIMMKEEQIEQLNKSVIKYEYMENQLKIQYEKYQTLDREYDMTMQQKDEEIRELAQKLSRERQTFLHKLLSIQKQSTQDETLKQRLLEKTSYLQGTVEKSEMIIEEYEAKLMEIENQLSQQKLENDKERARSEVQLEGYKEDVKYFKKQQKQLSKVVEQLRTKQRETKQSIQRLTRTNEDLTYRLSLKKKKDSKALKDKITSSFAGVSKNNPVYASFAFRQRDSIIDEEDDVVTPKHLGDYPEILEFDGLIENFNMEELGRMKSEDVKEKDLLQKEKQKELPISQMMAKKKNNEVSETLKAETAAITDSNTIKDNFPTLQTAQNPQNGENPQHYAPNPEAEKEIQTYKQTILRFQTEKKQLHANINETYNQVEQLNLAINQLTAELQQERKSIAELRQQLKRTKKQSKLIVEMQSLTLHVEKLQMDMVASKLKYAEEAEFTRQKYKREKVIWTHKLVQLTEKIAKQDMLIQTKSEQKKKKKGFFS